MLKQLSRAVCHNEWDVVLSLVTPENVNAHIDFGGSLLFTATKSGRRDVVEALLRLGANPNVSSGRPPIEISPRLPDTDITRLLLEAGADPNSNFYGTLSYPLAEAAFRVNNSQMKLLVDWGANIVDDLRRRPPEWVRTWVNNREACRTTALRIMALQRYRRPAVCSGQDMNVLRMVAKQIWSNRM